MESPHIFRQIAQELRNQIVSGALPEGAQCPSTNELAAFYRVNPATAAKGLTLLSDQGIVVKRRGIGMFVADGARAALLAQRRDAFAEDYLIPLIREAQTIGLTEADIMSLIHAEVSS